eukprot:CAMPEP_0115856070 /NCGR_PEP_ID=MMETSP0287-20121206/14863_1 /TAXON_ID=412157 /ORGANISM="Chrysochromulina rotalis, Strain UIO044" /LENGTH=156 /DNA_ID=CAMNT_0003310233 /DNA_START=348 /DNA_END=818 /DNA_ORIENTATION=-
MSHTASLKARARRDDGCMSLAPSSIATAGTHVFSLAGHHVSRRLAEPGRHADTRTARKLPGASPAHALALRTKRSNLEPRSFGAPFLPLLGVLLSLRRLEEVLQPRRLLAAAQSTLARGRAGERAQADKVASESTHAAEAKPAGAQSVLAEPAKAS